MLIGKYIERLRLMHALISHKKTGNPKQFAKTLGICESHVYNLINEFCELGVPIAYNRTAQTYYYKQPIEFNLEVYLRNLSTGEKIILK